MVLVPRHAIENFYLRLHGWLGKLAPLSLPIRTKTKTNRGSIADVFRHIDPTRKLRFSKRSSNHRNLKTLALRFSVDKKRFENNKASLIMMFPYRSLTHTQIQIDQSLLRFQILQAQCGRKIFDAFPERNLRFQIPPTKSGCDVKNSFTHAYSFYLLAKLLEC